MNTRFASTLCALALLAGCSRSGSQPGASGAPNDAEAVALNNRGVGLMGQFEYPDAVAAFTGVVQEHPGWADAQVNLAIATLNRQSDGDEETSLQILQSVVESNPDNARAWYCMGILKRYLGPPYDAAPDFARAIELAPWNAEARYFLGQCLMDQRDFEGALAAFERAVEIDPYQRSAQFGVSRALRALGRDDDATAALELFDRLERNPRARTVEFKYSRMGDLAMTVAVGAPDMVATAPRPAGPVWSAPRRLEFEGATWRRPALDERISVTAVDIDSDNDIDLFVANALTGAARNAVLLNTNGEFAFDPAHPLADTPDVRAALWGDYDNDGLTDVYLCRNGPNVLYRQSSIGVWEDVTSATGTANGNSDTVDGAFVDADHDGDLDLFLVSGNGKNELLNNDLNGAFRTIATAQNIAGNGLPSRQVVFTDLDRDRDADILVLHEKPPHEAYFNDRLWEYRPAEGLDAVLNADLRSLIAVDLDSDGSVELVGRLRGRELVSWRTDENGVWIESSRERRDGIGVAALDSDGDGVIETITPDHFAWNWPETPAGATAPARSGTIPEHWGWTPVVLNPDHGAAVALYGAIGVEPGVHLIEPGSGRYNFVALSFSGREDQGQSMRSNASGVGVRYEARRGVQWTIGETFDTVSSPGQSLQPTVVGLGGAESLDFVALDWPDGVFQSEVAVSGGLQRILETQRQLSSCPLVFAWDGEQYRFISDILGVGGLGYAVEPGEYAEPRPWENFLFPEGSIAPRDGRMVVKIGEPMEEVCYLDSVRLVSWDLPPGWGMTLDERMGIGGPAPTGEPVFFRREITPIRAWNDRGEDQTSEILDADARAADVGALDHRFIGMLAQEHVLSVEFGGALDAHEGVPTLVIDGWVEYPYSQTNFAAWQAGAVYEAPTLDARDAAGEWVTIDEQFGYPAGMPRQMSVPLADLPAGTTALRLRTNQEVYFDRIAVVYAEECPDVVRIEAAMSSARLTHTGYPARTTGAQRVPHYDYSSRTPFWDARAMRGLYSRFGPVEELVRDTDGALAIFGPGEEVQIEFLAPNTEAEVGWDRRWTLESAGWCKDMDLFTRDGDTVGPIPGQNVESALRESLHAWYNVRMQSGR